MWTLTRWSDARWAQELPKGLAVDAESGEISGVPESPTEEGAERFIMCVICGRVRAVLRGPDLLCTLTPERALFSYVDAGASKPLEMSLMLKISQSGGSWSTFWVAVITGVLWCCMQRE
jgi:hypothetical protein